MNCTLRTPQAIDFEAIASWVTNREACLSWAGPRLPFPFSAPDLPALLSVADGESLCLAEGSARPYGFGQFWVSTPGAVHLGRIIVAPTMRGRGFGRTLCRQLIAEAVLQTGARRITLRVYRDNLAAIALYLGLGFSAVESESTGEVFFMSTAPGFSR